MLASLLLSTSTILVASASENQAVGSFANVQVLCYEEPFETSDVGLTHIEQLNETSNLDENNGLLEDFDRVKQAREIRIKKISPNNGVGTTLHVGAVNGLSELIVLDVSRNEVVEIRQQAFQNLDSLKVLDLSFNNVTSLKAGTFNNLPVSVVILQANSIASVEHWAFSEMPNLEEVDLSYNQITTIGIPWFSNTPNLNGIDLSYNLIQHLPKEAFAFLNSRDYSPRISLQSNLIDDVDVEVFNGVSRLSDLDLSNNTICNIDYRMFGMFSYIDKLDLSTNCFNCLDGSTLHELLMVGTLNLEGNYLFCNCSYGISDWADKYGKTVRPDLQNVKCIPTGTIDVAVL